MTFEPYNDEFSCPAESPMAEPSDRSADESLSHQRCTQGVNCNDLLGISPVQTVDIGNTFVQRHRLHSTTQI